MKKVAAVVASPFTFNMNYFKLFNLPVKFDLDLEQLDRVYFSLQKDHHPDQAKSKDASDSLKSTLLSMQINDAYTTFKSNLSRAEYLLSTHNIIVNSDHQDTVKPSYDLLEQIMDDKEYLAELKNRRSLQNFKIKIEQQIQQIENDLSALFEQALLPQAAEQTIKLRYLYKLLQNIKDKDLNLP